MLVALGALRKALGWAVEIVVDNAFKSKRMWAESCSDEEACVWTLGKGKGVDNQSRRGLCL